ncbi:hypothetical protein OUZ56_013231 [Daphnia magna]|uniref:Uncharacterized protein n=1 Tax=Daphnia magna TaxID=35525 RepID=A0ABQ9Z5D1_9CRUS|nr:hypothetical protein OUZ56_013231 [Daphnia magna]
MRRVRGAGNKERQIAGKNTVRWGGHGIILAVYTSFHDEHVNTQATLNFEGWTEGKRMTDDVPARLVETWKKVGGVS